MGYEVKLITKEQQKTSKWSGGTTTQLAIYPEDADYGKRNFTWRLSTATVEAAESVFTSLPGIDRIIKLKGIPIFLIQRAISHTRCVVCPLKLLILEFFYPC